MLVRFNQHSGTFSEESRRALMNRERWHCNDLEEFRVVKEPVGMIQSAWLWSSMAKKLT